MDNTLVIGSLALAVAVMFGAVVVYFMFFARQESPFRNLMGSQGGAGMGYASETRERLKNDPGGKEYGLLKRSAKLKTKKKEKATLDEKFFRAGIFTSRDKREFYRLRILAPIIITPIGFFLGSMAGGQIALFGAIFSLLVGLQLPYSILDRQIKQRDEDIMFFLPLVIEQIAIGVSSSLDIGPCLQRVVSMADERDTHNVVTELVRHAQHHVRSGASLEDALNEVGKKSGHTELKHSFLSLSQVAKHGGEITRQLQELADAVASQRETRIDGIIKKLELKATFPVTLVFLGFILILLIGFFIQMKNAF